MAGNSFSSKSTGWPRGKTVLLTVLFLLVPALGQAALQLGSHTFAFPPANFLQEDPTPLSEGLRSQLEASLGSYDFLARVGGVAFAGSAVGPRDFKIVDLKYAPERRDGERLQVTLQF